MSYENQISRITRLIKMIDESQTGSTEELAKKLNISIHTILKDLDYLKGKGLLILYDSTKKKFQLQKQDQNIPFF